MIAGTAGHVDHGKTQLIRALTGVDTDRLKEEKARGISIGLGFAYMPDGQGGVIGFVDVPGHERFVDTMLAGASGIDFALLVIAADDGVMPQTREHLQILDLLGLNRGLIVLSKADLAGAERRSALMSEIRLACRGSSLAAAEILPVSSLTGEGLAGLRDRLVAAAAGSLARPADAPFRFSADRGFTLTGTGLVATGTIVSGEVRPGDTVMILPAGLKARVRAVHIANQAARHGIAGQRCALNLAGAGVSKDAIGHGSWLVDLGGTNQSPRFDMALRLLSTEPRALAQWTPVHVHFGASSTEGRVVLLADEPLQPGANGLVQIVLPAPLPVRHGDRIVLRDTSAMRTIGGGTVLDPRAPQRKRRSPQRLARLEALAPDDPAEALTRLTSLEPGFEDLTAFAEDWPLHAREAGELAERLGLLTLSAGPRRFVAAQHRWAALRLDVEAILAKLHADQPELPGLAIEHLRLALDAGLSRPLVHAMTARLVHEGAAMIQGHVIRLAAHDTAPSRDDAALWARIEPLIEAEKFQPPRVRDLAHAFGISEGAVRKTCKSMVRAGDLIEIAQDHFFARSTVAEMAVIAADLSGPERPDFPASGFRDRLGNGRKVAIQILEFFDRQGFTLRRGDLRRTVKHPAAVFGPAPEGPLNPGNFA